MLFEFLWAFLVFGASATVYVLCILEIYEGKRPDQGQLSNDQKKAMQTTITWMSLIAGAIVGAFFGVCKIWS
jgi:hypothetical protein